MRILSVGIGALAIAIGSTGCATSSFRDVATTVLVVRHAEKAADGGEDPPLSGAGRDRARALAEISAVAGVDAVYVTQYRRTLETVAQREVEVVPIAVDFDNPKQYLDSLKERLVRDHLGGTVLVVSHGGNVIPAIIDALSGVKVPAITDPEYSRLYVLTLRPGRPATVVAAEYGCRSGTGSMKLDQ